MTVDLIGMTKFSKRKYKLQITLEIWSLRLCLNCPYVALIMCRPNKKKPKAYEMQSSLLKDLLWETTCSLNNKR